MASAEGPDHWPAYHSMSVGRYLSTRISSLKPPMTKAPNPIKLLRSIHRQQWAFFMIAFLAWTWDAFDFFTVSLTVEELADEFGKTTTDITWGITLVLMFRSVGSILFGIAADRWGRKWPFVVNNLLFIVLELGTGFCNTYKQFLACRARGNIGRTFVEEGKVALRRHWALLIYLVLLMAGFNFMSHGSQDLYPTMLKNQFGFDANQVTVTQVVANLGAITGGTVVGFSSQIFGRRLSILVMCVVGGALLYPYTFVENERVIASAFFEQFCVQGAWGVVPIHLMELSPGAFRTFVVGTSYQLGNLVSSASSTIEATIGERFPLPPRNGVKRYEYGKVICIFLGCVYAYLFVMTLLGPEALSRSFDPDQDEDFVDVAGRDAVEKVVGGGAMRGRDTADDEEKAQGTSEHLA